MGAKAEHDLWGQALAIENEYGDRGPDVLKDRIRKLREAGEAAEAGFWLEVAACLNDLHAIRLDVPATKLAICSVTRTPAWPERPVSDPP